MTKKEKVVAAFTEWLDTEPQKLRVGRQLKPEFIAEIFVTDTAEKDGLIIPSSITKVVLPFAKVLAVSEALTGNEDMSQDVKDLKVGDIVSLNDAISYNIVNPAWEQWVSVVQQSGGPLKVKTKEPRNYLPTTDLMVNNNYYHPNKIEMALDSNLTTPDQRGLKGFENKNIFRLSVADFYEVHDKEELKKYYGSEG